MRARNDGLLLRRRTGRERCMHLHVRTPIEEHDQRERAGEREEVVNLGAVGPRKDVDCQEGERDHCGDDELHQRAWLDEARHADEEEAA